jgi:predicted Fe-Mo cluster-binding NifX family protein
VPVDGGRLSEKFGEATAFALFKVKDGAIVERETIPTPPPQPGGLPEWLEDRGVTHVIAAALGEKAKRLLTRKDIEVVAGSPQEAPEELVEKYLKAAGV